MQLWRYKGNPYECKLVLVHRAMSFQRNIQKTNKSITAYNKQQIPALGTARLSMRNPRTRKKYNAEFAVVDGNQTPLTGARAAQQMRFLVIQHHNIQLVSSNQALTASPSTSLTKEQVLPDFADIVKGLRVPPLLKSKCLLTLRTFSRTLEKWREVTP